MVYFIISTMVVYLTVVGIINLLYVSGVCILAISMICPHPELLSFDVFASHIVLYPYLVSISMQHSINYLNTNIL